MNLEEKLVDRLIEKNYQIAFAETCTGGMMASKIIDVPNASKVLNCSFITYSNEAKIKYVNVQPTTLETFGAVSEEVAKEMAFGVAKETNAQIGVGITGIAGPLGGTKDKPVGMVCFAIQVKNEVYSYTEYFLNKSRQDVRNSSVEAVMRKILELL